MSTGRIITRVAIAVIVLPLGLVSAAPIDPPVLSHLPSRLPKSIAFDYRADCGSWGTRTIRMIDAAADQPGGSITAVEVSGSAGAVDVPSLARFNAGLSAIKGLGGISLICFEHGADILIRGVSGRGQDRQLSFTWSRSALYQRDERGKMIGYPYPSISVGDRE